MDKINHDRNKKKDSTKIGMDSIGHDRNKKKNRFNIDRNRQYKITV